MSEHIGAKRYERTDERRQYRNGYRLRRLTTRVGRLSLRVPQTREGSFSSELFQRYQRSEQALVLALMESETKQEAREAFAKTATHFAGQADGALQVLEAALDDATAVLVLPSVYRRRLRTTNMQERLNEEIRRRERVIRIFPNDDSAVRLIGALLAEQHEAWVAGRRYFDMEIYWQWKRAREAPPEAPETVKSAA